MTAFLSALVAVFLALVVMQLTYWHIIRPIILLKLRYALFEIRDNLRLMVIRKEIGGKQPAYGILEELCNLSLYTLEYAGLSVINNFPHDPASILRVERNLEIIREAEPQLQTVFEDITRVKIGIVICNSPGWIPWIIFSVLGAYWSQRERQRIDQWKRDAMGMTYETT